jgi:hypothetical protein
MGNKVIVFCICLLAIACKSIRTTDVNQSNDKTLHEFISEYVSTHQRFVIKEGDTVLKPIFLCQFYFYQVCDKKYVTAWIDTYSPLLDMKNNMNDPMLDFYLLSLNIKKNDSFAILIISKDIDISTIFIPFEKNIQQIDKGEISDIIAHQDGFLLYDGLRFPETRCCYIKNEISYVRKTMKPVTDFFEFPIK